MNSVLNILNNKFSRFSLEEKLNIKELGRPMPNIKLTQTSYKSKKPYSRKFNVDLYKRHKWLCGSSEKNALFCFPCLLFEGDDSWARIGVTDLAHLSVKIGKHEASVSHINNEANLAVLGKVNIKENIDSAYKQAIECHNQQVTKNRYILLRIIKAIKFCANLELPLRGHDESSDSMNPGVFKSLIEYSAELDPTLRDHLKSSNVFKGTSMTIQNDLLSCSWEICRMHILKEISQASFIGIIADETSDISNEFQLTLILRYEYDGNIKERFWGLFNPASHRAESIASVISDQLKSILPNCPEKLIAQSYDGAAVMSGHVSGVNVFIKDVYPNAHYVHCYAHQINLIMTQSVSQIPEVGEFFRNMSLIPTFFSQSPQRCSVLDEIIGKRLPKTVKTRWNFNIRTVNMVFEHRELLLECFEKILNESKQPGTRDQAGGLQRLLTDPTFVFWLTVFRHIMPHVDCFYNKIQSRNADVILIKQAVSELQLELGKIRNSMTTIMEEIEGTYDVCEVKRRRSLNASNYYEIKKAAAYKVCDIIISQSKERFSFSDHLLSAQLFEREHFKLYRTSFPTVAFEKTVTVYPFFNILRLKSELQVIYSREDFYSLKGALDSYKYIIENGMDQTFEETLKLLKILITTPMASVEAERCFSRLKRIKTVIRNTMGQERLNALVALATERDIVQNPSFDNLVIDLFASQKARRMDFSYKL